jgi:hypothetical protein
LKASSATSARAAKAAPRPIGQSSARPRPTRTSAEQFVLSGPSSPPDPDHNAYRKDLADVALAGRVIASHYAEPLDRVVTAKSPLRTAPNEDALAIAEIEIGDHFAMLDNSLGWAWGYAGCDRRVGYIRGDALGGQ